MKLIQTILFSSILIAMATAQEPAATEGATPQKETAHVRFIWSFPKVETVDVWVNAKSQIKALQPNKLSDFIEVPAGVTRMVLRDSGTQFSLWNSFPKLEAGARYTAAISLGNGRVLQLIDEAGGKVPEGKGLVTFINMTPPNLETLDIEATSPVLEGGKGTLKKGLASAQSAPAGMLPGDYVLKIANTGKEKVAMDNITLKVEEGKKQMVVIAGDKEKLSVQIVSIP